MAKKINCKHGLTHKQEIEARRLRKKIESYDAGVWQDIIRLREQWLDEGEETFFLDYLSKNGHTILFSAMRRITDSRIIHQIYFKTKV